MTVSASTRLIIALTNDLSPERGCIGKVLKSLLKRDGFDLRDIAKRLIAHGWYYDPEMSDTKMSWEEIGDDIFFLVKEADDFAVMSASAPLGSGFYDGRAVWLGKRLPQTICVSIIGMQLGKVISTGVPALDSRVIVDASTCDKDAPADIKATRVMLSPDLVELCTATNWGQTHVVRGAI